jgi:hypothetical protein
MGMNSPDITKSDFWLPLRLKMGLKGHHFVSIQEILQDITTIKFAGPSVYVHKDSILKVTMLVFTHTPLLKMITYVQGND